MAESAIYRKGLCNVVLGVSLSFLLAGCGGGGGSCGGSAALVGLASCGGSGGESSPATTPVPTTLSTGTFLDSPVAGINYSTETQSGQTDANGHFSYYPGENVTFSVGAVKLPTVPAKAIVTPLDLAKTTDLNNQLVVNIAVFLQTLNQNIDSTRGITISEAAHAAATAQIDFNVSSATFSSNPNLLDLVKNAGSPNASLVSEASAKSNLQTTLSGANGGPRISIAPIANAGSAQSVTVGATVSLSGADSSDANGDPITYLWSLASVPSGSSVVLANDTSVNPTFVPDAAGSYIVNLTVNDGGLSSAASSVTISATLANIAPTADTGVAQAVAVGSIVTLNGAGSSDVDGDVLTYAWSIVSKPSSSAAELADATSSVSTFTADVAGSYVVGLTVSDGKTSSPLVTITITSGSSNSPTVIGAGTVASPYIESELVKAGSFNPNGFVKSTNSGKIIDLRWGTLDTPLALSSSDNVTFTIETQGTAGLFFRRFDGATFSYALDEAFVNSAPSNKSTLAMQNLWITQSVLAAWSVGLSGSKVNVAIIDDFTVNDVSEIQGITLPNRCVNITAGGTTVLYCTMYNDLLSQFLHGDEVAAIISGLQKSNKLVWASSGPYADPDVPTVALGTISTLQLLIASRSSPTYGIAYGANATTSRSDYLTYQSNSNGLFNQLQSWGAGTDTGSIGYQNSRVINLSLGGTSANKVINSRAYFVQLAYAVASTVPDAVFVKAAGNSACTISNTDCDAYNAVLHDANNFKDKSLIVGALAEAGGAIASYSNRAGSYSDRFVVADGRGLLKTSGAYDQGTSFAAPRVAGYLAIMRQKYPNLTAEEVASIILSTAKWNPVWGEKNAANQEIYGQGEADLDRALAAIGSLP